MSRIVRLTAIVLTALVTAIAVTNTVSLALRGRVSAFSEDGVLGAVASVAHVACWIVLVAVLWTGAAHVFRGPWLRGLRWALAAVLGVAALTTALAGIEIGIESELLWNLTFHAHLALPGVLGVTLLVRGDRSPSAWLLAGSLVGTAVLLAIGGLVPEWINPGWFQLLVLAGLALLGVDARASEEAEPATGPVPVAA